MKSTNQNLTLAIRKDEKNFEKINKSHSVLNDKKYVFHQTDKFDRKPVQHEKSKIKRQKPTNMM